VTTRAGEKYIVERGLSQIDLGTISPNPESTRATSSGVDPSAATTESNG
jgi:hypothetical protein